MDVDSDRVLASGNAIRRNPMFLDSIKQRFGTIPIVACSLEEEAYGAALIVAVNLGLVDRGILFDDPISTR